MPDDIKEIVKYFASSILELPDDNGKTHYINPGCYPYLQKDVDMVYDDQGNFSYAVRRALRMYSTDEYVKPDAAIEARFSQQLWGVTTDEIMMSITRTTPHGWKNIIKAVIPYIIAYKSHTTSCSALKEPWEGPNAYVACFD
ncbi:hypothetical protein BDR07DRAFT_1375770 [Suillus spraguei]|nr:hypothetical protein BDR07DRAFT_1375770 [Suillus spraguei]